MYRSLSEVVMTEIEQLISELRVAPPDGWVASAAVALQSTSTKFAGQSERTADTSVESLIRIYEVRLSRREITGVDPVGIEFLLKRLHSMPQDALVLVRPFLSDTHSVTAFYDASLRLFAAVTVARKTPDSGAANLARAMEK